MTCNNNDKIQVKFIRSHLLDLFPFKISSLARVCNIQQLLLYIKLDIKLTITLISLRPYYALEAACCITN